MNESVQLGFKYQFQGISPDGSVLWEDTARNLIPADGREYIAGRAFGSTTQVSDWYMGLFEASGYTPDYSDTVEHLVDNASESTKYAGGSRITLDADMISAESWGTTSACEFEMESDATIYGAFIASSQAHDATTGKLLSEVKMSSPKQLDAGAVLRVHAQITLLT